MKRLNNIYLYLTHRYDAEDIITFDKKNSEYYPTMKWKKKLCNP